jgi:hypothetical protein
MARKKEGEGVTGPRLPRPSVEVLERSLANPFGLPDAEVRLTDPSVLTHWCNTGIGGHQLGKYLDAGYLKVTPDMLADRDRVSFVASPEGYVVRGHRGEEILLYTPRDWYRRRQEAKEAENRAAMDPMRTKRQLVQAASEKLGDEAATYLDGHVGPTGSVRDSYERIEVLPEGVE